MTIAARHIDITTEEIVCDNGMPAFLAYPTGGGKFPTVVIMHERYGLVKHTKDQAMRCARDGFAVLAPNFFFRHPVRAWTASQWGRTAHCGLLKLITIRSHGRSCPTLAIAPPGSAFFVRDFSG